MVAEVDAVCLDSWVMTKVGFVAGVDTWVGLVTGAGVGSVLVAAEVSGVELIEGEGEVSEVVVERDRGMSVEVGIGLVMGVVVELDGVAGLISGLDSGDRAGLAREMIGLFVGLDKGPGAGCVVETDVGVGLDWIIGVVEVAVA